MSATPKFGQKTSRGSGGVCEAYTAEVSLRLVAAAAEGEGDNEWT